MHRSIIKVVVLLFLSATIAPCSELEFFRPEDSRLKSAYLLRDVNANIFAFSMTEQVDRQLRTHFDAVIERLERRFSLSIEQAMERLEKDYTETPFNRILWKHRLELRRRANIHRLRTYRDAGRFPQNQQSKTVVPIFVDESNTACAVGHLMREAGRQYDVRSIRALHNLVFVTDIIDGPVIDWVLKSGLTLEEAALIQPGYPPLPVGDFAALSENGYAVEGITYQNFQYQILNRGEYQIAPSVEELLLIDMAHGERRGMNGPRPPKTPFATRSLLFESIQNSFPEQADRLSVLLSYDITVGDDQTISTFNLVSHDLDGVGETQITIDTKLLSGGNEFASLSLHGESDHRPHGSPPPSVFVRFEPTSSLTVQSQIDIQGRMAVPGFTHEFRATAPNAGDLNQDGAVDVRDIDFFDDQLRLGEKDERFDLNRSGNINERDRRYLVNALIGKPIGDVNFDGSFNSSDLVRIFETGKYRKGESANWAAGDFDGNRRFGSSDLQFAFENSGQFYEQGRVSVAVPEPTVSFLACLVTLLVRRKRRSESI